MRARRDLTIGVIVGVLLAASCGSSGDDDGTIPTIDFPDETTTTEVVETTTSTSAPESLTTETSIESALADMERPELVARTEWESDLDEIFGRYLMYWEALYNAFGPPVADPGYEPLLELLDPGAVALVQAQVQEYRDANAVGLRVESSLDDHGLRLPNPSVLTKTEGNRVVIQDCWIRDEVVRTLDGETIAEYFNTVLWNVDMIVIDGEWRLFASNEAGPDSDGYQECQDLFDTLER